MYVMLRYTDVLFGDGLARPYQDAITSDEGEALLDIYGLTKEERRRWPVPFLARLFDAEILYRIRAALSQTELEKIAINQAMM